MCFYSNSAAHDNFNWSDSDSGVVPDLCYAEQFIQDGNSFCCKPLLVIFFILAKRKYYAGTSVSACLLSMAHKEMPSKQEQINPELLLWEFEVLEFKKKFLKTIVNVISF